MGIGKLAIYAPPLYCNDKIFNLNSSLNRDGCLSCYDLLKRRLLAAGWETHTHDIYRNSGKTPDAVLFTSVPKQSLGSLLGEWSGRSKLFVILSECEVIQPENWDFRSHAVFDAVFTWSVSLVDNVRYFRLNFSNPVPETPEYLPMAGRKFCVMIAGNKRSAHPKELYSERESIIKWFNANSPQDFDLFGTGWEDYVYSAKDPRWKRLITRTRYLRKLLSPGYAVYKGPVVSKNNVLRQYKFSISYENARDIPGYITEKIFDSLYAGSIPVYLGAPDISKYVPNECFIDRREYSSNEELVAYLRAMSESEFSSRLSAMSDFVKSMRAGEFSDIYFADTISGVVLDKCLSKLD